LNESVVRQALNYATPGGSIISVVFKGLAPRSSTVLQKLRYWTPNPKPYPYDLKKARELLAKSSVPNGFSTTLLTTAAEPLSQQIAQIVQQSWKEIGVNVKIKPLDDPNTPYGEGNYELFLSQPGTLTSDIPVEDEFATLFFNSKATNNFFMFYKNPTTQRLAGEAVSETDEARRAKLFEELNVASMKDPNSIPIAYTPNRAAVRDSVHNFNYLLMAWWRLQYTWIQ